MLPFVVLRNDDDSVVRGTINVGNRMSAIIYSMMLQESTADYGGEINNKSNYYQVRNRADAEALANYLAQRYPGTSWTVAQCTTVYQSEPGPVTAAQFTEQGLMPVN